MGRYPLLPSGNILVSDMQSGLFVLSPIENNNSDISENTNDNFIFPNPFTNQFKIQKNNANPIDLKIYDLNGKLLFSEKILDNNTVQPNLTKGIYFLEIKSKEKLITEKIIRL